MKPKYVGIMIVVLAGLYLFLQAAYVVDETEQVVVTRFRKVMRTEIIAGLKFKLPFLEEAHFYPKNLQEWDGDSSQIPTLEKRYIVVNAFARWKIVDPVIFFQTVKTVSIALKRLDEVIDPAVRNAITENRLIETVRRSNRALDTIEIGFDQDQDQDQDDQAKLTTFAVKYGRQKISQAIMDGTRPKVKQFGIELLDVKIKRINYVEEVRKTVYERMIAERQQIAEKFRSEGMGEAQKIIGRKEKDLKEISSQAYKIAQELMGTADAEAASISAAAYGVDPEFYSFIKTLEVYKETMGKDSTLVLSTKSEFLKYLKDYIDP